MNSEGNPTAGLRLSGYQNALDILLILAQAIETAFSAPGAIDTLDASNGNWIEMLKVLGRLQSDPDTQVFTPVDIPRLWQRFFSRNDLQALEAEARAVFDHASAASEALVNSQLPPLGYITRANLVGHNLVVTVLQNHRAFPSAATPPRSIELFYDGPGKEYCAGSHRWTAHIRWAFQSVPHALLGLLISEFIFAHEYLSHLFPANKHLDATIREQWLVAALREAMEEDGSIPYWKTRLWPTYRQELEDRAVAVARILHPDASPVRFSGFAGAEEAFRHLSWKHQDLFWRLTGELLASGDDDNLAAAASEIAFTLVTQRLPDLTTNKPSNINEMAATLKPKGNIYLTNDK